MRLNNERGVALAITLLVVMVLLIFGRLFILRTVNEKNIVDRERKLTQALYIAEGGSDAAIDEIDKLINTDLLNTINITNPQTVGNKANGYVANGDGVGFLIEFVKEGATPQLTLTSGNGFYNGATTNFGSGNFDFDIIISEKSNPIAIGVDQWDFPYYYRIESKGTVGSAVRKVLLNGDFTVRVQKDNFAKFALFTDHHGMPSGGTVWFTSKTNFAGPIHTNEQFAFAFNPSGIFDGIATQQNTKGKFYNNGSPVQINANSNPPYDVPTFNAGYNRGVAEIVLSSSVQKQDMIDQTRANDSTPGNGIFLANNGASLTGGIYVSGDATIDMAVDASHNALYTITQGSTTKKVTVDKTNNQTSVETVGSGTVTYSGLPDGVDNLGTLMYVNGKITSLKGTIQKDTEVTVSSESDISITDNIRYENYNPAVGNPGDVNYVPPNATNETNLFGIVCWGGNVRVGTAAPTNIDVQAIIMARNGVFTVDNYNDTNVGPRGTATLLGGAITQFYGAFGLYSGSTGQLIAGYGRNFVYDDRTAVGKSPPYFPSMKTFIAFTNDITDKIAWQEGGF